jgi:hypothetical protein
MEPESTMTFTPAQGSEALAEAVAGEGAAVDAGAEAPGWVAGAEQPARANRRPAAARELAAVRIVVKVTCQG